MDDMQSIKLRPQDSLHLAHKVVIGTVDIAAVGARVLLALQAPPGWTVKETAVEISGLRTASGPGASTAVRPVLSRTLDTGSPAATAPGPGELPQGDPVPALLVRSFYPPSGGSAGTPGASSGNVGGATGAPAEAPDEPVVSLVVLNVPVPDGDQAEVAAALVDFVTGEPAASSATTTTTAVDATAAAVEQPQSQPAAGTSAASGTRAPADVEVGVAAERALYVAAALLLQHLAHPAALYQHLLNGATPPGATGGLPTLPGTSSSGPPAAAANTVTHVRDGQLAALLHVLEVSGTPACCLLTPGHKPPATTSLDLPDSAAACDLLGAALAGLTGLEYCAPARCSVLPTYKWFVPEKSAGSDVMYL